MVKLVGAVKNLHVNVRNFRVNIRHIQINVEDGTGLLRVILWRKERVCTAQHCLIDKCNRNHYIRVQADRAYGMEISTRLFVISFVILLYAILYNICI
jgi:hypothetical protein